MEVVYVCCFFFGRVGFLSGIHKNCISLNIRSASLQTHETLDLRTPHASALRCWHFEKLRPLSSPDAHLWKKMYTLNSRPR